MAKLSADILARAARASSGLTQIEFAHQSGIAGSSLSLIEHGKREPTFSTLEVLLRAARHTAVIIPTVRSDAAHIAAEISEAISSSDDASAYRRFLQLADNLAAETGATKVGLTLTEPAFTGSSEWDLAIAALCEYRLNAYRLPIPTWITQRRNLLKIRWTPYASDYEIPVEIKNVPKEFLRRGILIEVQTLESI